MFKRNGLFYLLPNLNSEDELNFEKQFIFYLTQKHWRLGKTILIACEDIVQAYRINEALWNFEPNSFLPHDLFKKKSHSIPIIIYWNQCCYDNNSRDLLINLMKKNKNFYFKFNEIIDFVPTNKILKELARIRYKSYRNLGFHLNVLNAPIHANN